MTDPYDPSEDLPRLIEAARRNLCECGHEAARHFGKSPYRADFCRECETCQEWTPTSGGNDE
jgi:hypothetical protein